MSVYYINLALILALAYPLCLRKPNKSKKIVYLAVTFGYMWFLATYRYDIGFDYNVYIRIFEQIKAADGFEALRAISYEPVFVLLTKLMAVFIDSPVVMYGVYETLILVPVALFIYRYCRDEDTWLSTWLYVTLTFFYTSMNFIRQSLACSVILLGYGFLRDKKPAPFLLLVLLAAGFHKTALIMVPVYFVCHLKLRRWLSISYAAAIVGLYIFADPILNFVTTHILPQYAESIYLTPFPLIFLVVPATLFGGLLALYPIWRKRYTESVPLLNMMLYSLAIWLFITRFFIIERFSMYVYIFVLISVPQAVSCLLLPKEETAKIRAEAEAAHGKKARSKEEQAKLKLLQQKESDHKKYYWSAVAFVLLLTAVYNDFGANVNGFHGVFPYKSVLVWMQNLGFH